jgi:hypothetical protein
MLIQLSSSLFEPRAPLSPRPSQVRVLSTASEGAKSDPISRDLP